MEEKKQTFCPLCGGVLKTNKNYVYCENRKIERQADGKYVLIGTCDFNIWYDSKIFRPINNEDIKILLAGGELTDEKGNTMTLDVEAKNGYYTHVEFAESSVRDFV